MKIVPWREGVTFMIIQWCHSLANQWCAFCWHHIFGPTQLTWNSSSTKTVPDINSTRFYHLKTEKSWRCARVEVYRWKAQQGTETFNLCSSADKKNYSWLFILFASSQEYTGNSVSFYSYLQYAVFECLTFERHFYKLKHLICIFNLTILRFCAKVSNFCSKRKLICLICGVTHSARVRSSVWSNLWHH